MTEQKLTPDLDEELNDINEEEESMDVLKDMIKTLDELPTEVLEQLAKNLDEIDEYNRNHPLDTKSDNN